MKRNAAVVGSTPEFVRWSIRMNCPLRQDVSLSAPDQVSRCLTNAFEAGTAIGEDRVIDGIGLKNPTTTGEIKNDSVKDRSKDTSESTYNENELLGFFVDEVLAPFGGYDFVSKTCHQCPANIGPYTAQNSQASSDPVLKSAPNIAGCFGMLMAEPLFIAQSNENLSTLSNLINSTIAGWMGENEEMVKTDPPWFGMWCKCVWEGRDLTGLWELIQRLETIVDENEDLSEVQESGNDRWVIAKTKCELGRLSAGIKQCYENNLTLDIQSFAAGFSDGLNWTVGSHCERCKAFQKNGVSFCGVCRRQGSAVQPRKRKVLGRRPYMPLREIVDRDTAEKLKREFDAIRQD